MADAIEIIISAVDSASEIFKSIIESASGMANDVESAVSGVDDISLENLESEFKEVTSEVERLQEELDQAHLNGDDIEADIIADQLAEAEAEAERLQEAIQNITSGGLSDASTDANVLEEKLQEATSEVERLKQELAFAEETGLVNDVEQLEQELAEAESEAERLSEALANIQSSSNIGDVNSDLEGLSGSAENAAESTEEAAGAMEHLGQAGDIFVASSLLDVMGSMSDTFFGLADSAGTYSDSIMRAGLEAEGAGVSTEEMTRMVSNLSDETGRAGGQIRESFIKATARGVTDMSSFQKMMEGAGAQATLLGTDIQTMGDKFSSMAQKDTLMARALAETGVTMDELGVAMGMTGATADEVKEKWKELDTNQRAAILGTAASMNEGKDANAEYKTSWAGLQEQVDIAKGRLERIIGSVILPVVIPAMELAGDIMDGLGDTIDGLMNGPLGGLISVIGTGAGIFMIATTGLLAMKNIIGFLGLESLVTSGYQALLTLQNVLLGETSLAAALGLVAEGEAASLTSIEFFGLSVAELAALWPLALIVAAIAAVIAIAYEVGKAFGWWSDAGEMFDAVKDGVMRLWNAFINHPDVQALIQALSDAWAWLSKAVGDAWQAVLDFFGVNTGSDFDFVRALIDGIGAAWDAITAPIRLVIWLVQQVIGFFDYLGSIDPLAGVRAAWDSFYGTVNNVVKSVLEFFGVSTGDDFDTIIAIMDGIRGLWESLSPAIGAVSGLVGAVTDTIGGLLDGSISVQDAIVGLWNSLVANLPVIFNTVFGTISQFYLGVLNYAWSIGSGFVNGVINYVSQLPAQFLSYLFNVGNNISKQGTNWVNMARNTARRFLNTIINGIRNLPRRVYDVLSNVVSSIARAIQSWINTASKKVSELVKNLTSPFKGIANTISGFLSGVKDALVKPFKQAWDKIEPIYNDIKNGLKNITGWDAFGGEAYGGEISTDIISGKEFNTSTGEYVVKEDNEIHITEDINLNLENVPAHIDTDTLIRMLSDRKVLQALTGNTDFQNLDAKIKQKIQAKAKRSRGR